MYLKRLLTKNRDGSKSKMAAAAILKLTVMATNILH